MILSNLHLKYCLRLTNRSFSENPLEVSLQEVLLCKRENVYGSVWFNYYGSRVGGLLQLSFACWFSPVLIFEDVLP